MTLLNNEEQKKIDEKVKQILSQGRIDAAITEARAGSSQETIDFLVYELLKNEQLWSGKKKVPHQALKAAELGASSETMNTLVQVCAARGWIEGAYKAAKMRAIPLSQQETDALVEGCVNQDDPGNAIKALEIGASQKAVDFLVAVCAKNGHRDWLNIGLEAVKRFGASSSVIDELIHSIIQEKNFSLATEFGEDTLGLVALGASSETVAALFESIVLKYYGDELYDKAIALSIPIDVVNAVLKSLIKQGIIYKAQQVAQSFNRHLTKEEIDAMVAVHASKGDVETFWKAAIFRGQPITMEEEDSLIENFKKIHWNPVGDPLEEKNTDISRYWAFCGIENAVVGARSGGEEAIHHLVMRNSPLGLMNDLKRQAKSEGRRPTQQEINDQIEQALSWLKIYDALNIAELGASTEIREKILQECLNQERGVSMVMVQYAARIRGRELSDDEMDRLVDRYIDLGNIVDALKAAKDSGSDLSEEEIQWLIRNYIEDKGLLSSTYGISSVYHFSMGRFMRAKFDERDWGHDPQYLAACIQNGELDGFHCWSRNASKEEILAVIEAFQRL